MATSGQTSLEVPLDTAVVEAPQQSLLPPIRRQVASRPDMLTQEIKALSVPNDVGAPKQIDDASNLVSLAAQDWCRNNPAELTKIIGMLASDCLAKNPSIRFKAREQMAEFVNRGLTNKKTGSSVGVQVNFSFTSDPKGAKY